MSSALYALGRTVARHRRAVVAAWLVLVALLVAVAALVSTGTEDNFAIPGTESQEAFDSLAVRFPEVAGAAAQIVVVAPDGAAVATLRDPVEAMVAALEDEPWVSSVLDPFADDVTGAISQDGTAALVNVQLDVSREDVTTLMRDALHDAGDGLRAAGATVEAGGAAFGITSPGVSPTEGTGLIIALVVLGVTFGSVVAAGIPLLTAVLAAAVSMAVISAATAFTSISSTAPLLALMIGLAVGIDYALLILSRQREHLADGLDPQEAVARSLATAGSAVVFAGTTVAIALVALGVAGIPFLTTIGVAAAGGVAVAVVAALTLLPAVIASAGTRLAPRPRRRPARRRTGGGTALRVVRVVTRRPVAVILLVLVGLAVVAIPARDLRLALPGPGTDDTSTTQRRAYDLIDAYFGPGYNGLLLVSADIITTTDPVGVMSDLATDLAAIDGVSAVSLATPNASGETGVVVLVPTTAPTDEATPELVTRIRDAAPALEQKYGIGLAVTGQTALEIDVSDRLAGALIPFGLVVVGLSIVLLTIVYRSFVVPLVGTIGYLVSVAAAFGATAAVFEWGWAADLLGVQRVGPVISFLPIILMGVLFGLAMDYQVFLVSRVREEYVRTGDAHASVLDGYRQSAPVITAAALIMASVFAAFIPEGDAILKPIAFALAVGVLIDAFLVRLIVMPAALSLFGRHTWWLPRGLDRVLPVVDIEGTALASELDARQISEQEPDLLVRARSLGLTGPRGPVYAGVDLEVRDGDLCILTGPPGSGRTALLLTLAGRMDPDEGELLVAGHPVPSGSPHVRAEVALAEMPGINDLDPALTVAQLVAERLAAVTSRPLIRAAQVDRATALLDELCAAAGRGTAPRRGTLVADLTPLDRTLLGVCLALTGSPRAVVVDDVDTLRSQADRLAAWRALDTLVEEQTSRGRRLSVIASCQEAAEPASAGLRRGVVHPMPVPVPADSEVL